MARIKIEDLDVEKALGTEMMRVLYGGAGETSIDDPSSFGGGITQLDPPTLRLPGVSGPYEGLSLFPGFFLDT